METAARDTDHHIRLPALRVAVATSEHEEAQLKDELLAVLLHDLRSPLGAVGVLTDLIAAMLSQGATPDARQIKLIQESVTKAQRVLDDAVEIQSIIRGSSTLTTSIVDLSSLVDACIEKARHAPYFRSTSIESHIEPEQFFVSVDLEKIESAILSLLEQTIAYSHGALNVQINASAVGRDVVVHVESAEKQDGHRGHDRHHSRPRMMTAPDRRSLKGRLGTRRLGESRYSFQICRKVLRLMGGQVEIADDEPLSIDIRLPAANG